MHPPATISALTNADNFEILLTCAIWPRLNGAVDLTYGFELAKRSLDLVNGRALADHLPADGRPAPQAAGSPQKELRWQPSGSRHTAHAHLHIGAYNLQKEAAHHAFAHDGLRIAHRQVTG